MKSLTQLRIRYRVVTSAFLGGADLSCTGLRPPSIKAALRFWYRAVDQEFSKRDASRAPVRESLLFDATENGAGQSKVLLTVADEQFKYLQSSGDRFDVAFPMAGHGEDGGSRPAQVTLGDLLPRSNDGTCS